MGSSDDPDSSSLPAVSFGGFGLPGFLLRFFDSARLKIKIRV